MPTPPKPVLLLKNERKSHRTKAELEQREKAEKSLVTGTILAERPEVKKNKIAHKEFRRISALLGNIEKNDAIYEPVINRYCLLQAECVDMETKRESIYEQAQRLEEKLEELGSDAALEDLRDICKSISHIYGTMIALDKQIMTKRKMLLDIEKENIMTIAAALRSIPKKVEEDKDEDPMASLLARRA